MAVVFLFSLAILASVQAEKHRYDGYQLFSVHTRSNEDVKFLRDLRESLVGLDFWKEPAIQSNATVLIPPALVEVTKMKLTIKGISFNILEKDIQKLVDASSERTPDHVVMQRRQLDGTIIDHHNYHNYSTINDYLNQLEEAYPCTIHLSNLSHVTLEHRKVTLVKLTGSSSTNTKPSVIIEAGIHAREWISPASILWIIEKLAKDYQAGESSARQMLDKFDWYIVPVTNPDGYDYTHTNERLWRKNRRQVSQWCYGVDLNRNFDIFWNTTGVSQNCWDDTYCGQGPFSEPETANIRDLFNELMDSVKVYLSVHSYSQLILVPWGYTEYVSKPTNSIELERVAEKMLEAIISKHGTSYRLGTAWELLKYAASGSSKDWALTRKPNIYTATFELRPDSSNSILGFLLCPSEIVPTAEELYESLKAMSRETIV